MNFFGKVFNGIGHAIAWLFSKAIPVAGQVAQDVAVAADSPLGIMLASIFGRGGAAVRADIEAIAGSVVAARNALGDAFASKAQDLGLDQKALASVEALYADLSKLIHGTPADASKA